jgi:hypothetical protein
MFAGDIANNYVLAKNEGVDQRTLYLCAFRDLDPKRANCEYRRFLHLRSVGDDTDKRINKKHCRCKPYKSQRGASLAEVTLKVSLWLKKTENIDYFDQGTNFNPLKF